MTKTMTQISILMTSHSKEMQKSIIYDLEIIRAIPTKDEQIDPAIEYCKGWGDHQGMGISIITTYASPGFSSFPEGIRTFVNQESAIPYDFPDFQLLLAEKPIVIGFNSTRFDDKVAQANDIDIVTNYDIYTQVRLIAGSAGTYSLKNLASANGLSKGEGVLAPLYWQMGRRDEVIAYAREEMETMVEILRLGLRGELRNSNNDGLINFPATNLDMTYFQELDL